jgi:hypothetical protein
LSLPSPYLTVPSLTSDQLYFGSESAAGAGILIGQGTPYGIVKLEGFDKPKVRSGNTSRPRARGSFVGLNLLDTRTITLTFDVGPPFGSYGNLYGALQALRTACSTEGTTEYPLWVRLPNGPQMACMARVLQKSVPWDVVADLGQLAQNCSLQWEATDPYLYTVPTTAPSIGLPAGSGGLSFPLSFPLRFGASNPNQITYTNTGDVPCFPVLVINGPCAIPAIQNTAVAGAPILSFDITLNTGDQLVVDTDLQSVVLYPAGQTVGTPLPEVLVAGSVWWSLITGTNYIVFTSANSSPVAGTLTMWSASAVDGLT